MLRSAAVFRWSLALIILALSAGAPIDARADSASLATSAEVVRSYLFDAQSALMPGDTTGAAEAVASAVQKANPLIDGFGRDSDEAQQLAQGLAAATAAAAFGDSARVAFARAQVWTSVLAGALERTISAIGAGDITSAQAWLLVRDFRPSTRFARPSAGATLALRDLERGILTPEAAVAEVRADLFDTYQANLQTSITTGVEALESGLLTRSTEAAGLVAGYWRMLSPLYESQFGIDQRLALDQSITTLATAFAAGDTDASHAVLPNVTDALNLFRAAPLSAEEQARRAGQLLLYLSLIPVEYGRGVKFEVVANDIEIQEAQSFYEGAQAAFNDLRIDLHARDPVATAEVASILATIQVELHAAGLRQQVADPSEIRDAAESATGTLISLFPEEWTRPGGDADFDVIASLLDEMERAVAAKQYQQAESARLEAYAIFEVGPEKRLMGFSPRLAQEVEGLFWQGKGDTKGLATLLASNSASSEIRGTRLTLDKTLLSAQTTLGAGRPADGAIIFNAATIVFREGLEAVLILVSLMASMVGANHRFKRPLAIGAIGALFASAGLFLLTRSVLASLSRYGEKLEAIISLVAIGILLLVMNWFFHKVYWTRWIAGHHARRRAILGGAAGQIVGLVLLGFTSVFREGGETVLFLQALVLDAGTAVVIEGVLLGLAATAVVGILVFVMQKKMPHRKMLIVTGVMIAVVLVVMVGNTVHVLQNVGWAPITPVGPTQFPFWIGTWFGLFATWESLGAQSLAFVFVFGSYFLAEMLHDRALAKIASNQQVSSSQPA